MNGFFDVTFFRGVAMIFIGLLPAFLVRYLATLAWDWWKVQPRERETKARRQRQILLALKEAADKNVYLIGEIEKYLKDGLPYFNVDLTLLDATASLKWEVLASPETCKHADLVRFELSHVARKVDRLMHVFFDPSARATNLTIDGKQTTTYEFMRWHLVKSLSEHLPNVKQQCEALRELICPEIDRLNGELGDTVHVQGPTPQIG